MRTTLALTIALSMWMWTGCSSTSSDDIDAASHVMNDAFQADADSDALAPDGTLTDGSAGDGDLQDGGGLDGSAGDGGIPTIADVCYEACSNIDICGGGTGNPDPACLTGPGSCGEDLLDCSVAQLLDVQACNDAFANNQDCMTFSTCLDTNPCVG